MTSVYFVTDDLTRTVVKSAGINAAATVFGPCPWQVGDLICFPESPLLAFRVQQRWFRAAGNGKPARWYLTVSKSEDPLPED